MVKKLLLVLLAWPLAAFAQGGDMHVALQQRRIVRLNPGVSMAEGRRVVNELRLNVVRELRIVNALVVEMPLGRLEETTATLAARPQVQQVEDDLYGNWLVGELAMPALPSLADVVRGAAERAKAVQPPLEGGDPTPPPSQEEGETPWGVARVKAPQAWGVTAGAGVIVAVVDTGVDGTHPDLAANFKGGFNAISTSTAMTDDHGHGTHVAGTIVAALDQKGVVGVAPQAGVVGVKVLDANGSGYISDIIAGIEWVAQKGYPVLNMSLGGSRGTDAFHEAVKQAVKAGVTVVCAAGNSGPPRQGQNSSVGFPAAYPESIAVSASDSADKLAYFSSRGPEVDFVAPGVAVNSSVPGGTYAKYSGTSMASPHMAGLAALAVARGARGPNAVRNALKQAAAPIAGLTPNEQGAGLVDAAKLVGATLGRR